MKLLVQNLAKIGSVSVDLNGITLIAGANDTGKSTCGKALCTLLTVFQNLPERVKRIRINRLLEVLKMPPHRQFVLREDDVVGKYLDGEMDVNVFLRKILSSFPSIARERFDVEALSKEAEDVRLLSDEEIQREAILRAFSAVFNGQYRPLTRMTSADTRHSQTYIELTSAESSTSVTLGTKTCQFKRTGETNCRAWYVSDPKIIDLLGTHYWGSRDWFEGRIVSAIHEALDTSASDPVSGAFDVAMMKKKIARLESLFAKVNDDKLAYDKAKGFLIRRKSFVSPLSLSNASMGLKGIALLRIMIENGILRPGDFLVLDEPEIHLHPAWQLHYAELVVLLRKEIGITILLTTHSPDFIQAIRVFSKKHGIMDDVTAYLTVGDERTRLKRIENDEWDELFDRFMPTVKLLEQLSTEAES